MSIINSFHNASLAEKITITMVIDRPQQWKECCSYFYKGHSGSASYSKDISPSFKPSQEHPIQEQMLQQSLRFQGDNAADRHLHAYTRRISPPSTSIYKRPTPHFRTTFILPFLIEYAVYFLHSTAKALIIQQVQCSPVVRISGFQAAQELGKSQKTRVQTPALEDSLFARFQCRGYRWLAGAWVGSRSRDVCRV